MKRKGLFYLLVFNMTIFLTGCWDQNEVDDLAIVIGIGVDRVPGENPIQITVQIVNPSSTIKSGEANGKPFVLFTVKGKTVYDAVKNFSKESSRKIFLSHNYVVVFGDKMARHGLENVLDYFEREPLFRRTSWMIVTNGSAKEILETEIDLQKFQAIGIKNMIKQFKRESLVKVIKWEDFISEYESGPTCATATMLEVSESKPQNKIKLNGTALFSKDKLAGYLDNKESIGLMWILNEIKEAKVGINCPGKEKGSINFKVTETKHSIEPFIKSGNHLSIDLDIAADSTIAEVNCENVNIESQQVLKELEKMQEKEIKNQIQMTIQKSQKLGTDPLQFGEAFRRYDNNEWKKLKKDWSKHFKEIEVSIHVTSKIRLTGTKSDKVKIIN
ncbi:Ger(x)C family spore germination protein [Neobacillus sp. NPDC093182]|uniref:Ger(x)C family spore germination protein n=1 Tax=Neobacillus sp. NPDC093182 TaxID=3364297 RepID=UPI003810EB99